MCLEKLQDFESNKNKIGYKIFYESHWGFGKYYINLFKHTFDVYDLNVKYKSVLGICCTYDIEYYTAGFHICDTIEDLRLYMNSLGIELYKICVVKVRYEDILHKGLEHCGSNTIVAKYMTLLEEIKIKKEFLLVTYLKKFVNKIKKWLRKKDGLNMWLTTKNYGLMDLL